MSYDVIFQGRLFAMAIVWGGGLLLAYDGLRLLRMFVTRRKSVQALEEFLFWMSAGLVIYFLIYRYNSGAVRNYVVFGMAVGMLLYRLMLSSFVIKAGCFILRPVRDAFRIFKTFIKETGKRLKSSASRVTIKLKKAKHKKMQKQGD
ncbi:MAG: spore cortex biosynthesis protein YabQ [Coprococcus sp.]